MGSTKPSLFLVFVSLVASTLAISEAQSEIVQEFLSQGSTFQAGVAKVDGTLPIGKILNL